MGEAVACKVIIFPSSSLLINLQPSRVVISLDLPIQALNCWPKIDAWNPDSSLVAASLKLEGLGRGCNRHGFRQITVFLRMHAGFGADKSGGEGA